MGAGAEPVELTAVEEDEEAHPRRRGAACAVLAGPAAVSGGQARVCRIRWNELRLTVRPSSS